MTSQKTIDAQGLLDLAGDRGLTGREYAALAEVTNGSATGLLSRMHLSGHAVRLKASRNGGGIYVHPDRVHGRPTVDRGERSSEVEPEPELVIDPVAALAEKEAELAAFREALGKQLSAARAEGIAVGWTDGYDEGVKRGQEQRIDRDEIFNEGRTLGRVEGEEVFRKKVAAVAGEMHKVIVESVPIRTHFMGCYKIHPECAVRALGRTAGLTQRPVGLYAAG